jgi:hypothetical protein
MIQFDDSVMYLNDDEWHIRPGLLTYVLLVSNISFLIVLYNFLPSPVENACILAMHNSFITRDGYPSDTKIIE